ncbi:adenosylmethionine--8-amino-7-oxononanoate transaminase [Thiomicrospira sp. ALE5]|uniref:adenosylmethionine--8-amino-7-oxononanoate transaminase n=1 Tax=Thiomicrospira sp. ALE5 TaxID=748650 RepID=UPI0008EA176B|nr:adenosylmethionine--8-amino-7-oxononanoate transaminase [Thiomicrospira sp. ALE5]SFR64385.1 adenosylmethionine-8-amino-7-oxononanoate aminotransferase [Thiomicrospira sp. ALE5]
MNFTQLDQQHIWHPYSTLPARQPALEAVDTNGCSIQLADGRVLLDAMSSWWSAIHGYNHPNILAAAHDQLNQMPHIMFGGFSHQPASELADAVLAITPKNLQHIFFADSGSIAVEVALKMALQYWKSIGQPQKSRFIALKHAYHGDTFGAMSVCDPVDGMHHLFAQNLMPNLFAEAPPISHHPDQPLTDQTCLDSLKAVLEQNHQNIAAFVFEPIIQGAGGMRFYSTDYLRQATALCREYDVLLIADEIATGLGRTGKLFACEWAGLQPDIMTLGKGLSAGMISLAATLCNERIRDGISRAEPGLLMHGPTFMANPLACRIAHASVKLLQEYDWQAAVNQIQAIFSQAWQSLQHPDIVDVRCLGGVAVIELSREDLASRIQQLALTENVWLRPFGKLVYSMPAYTITTQEAQRLAQVMAYAVLTALDEQTEPTPPSTQALPFV